ncbi:sugar ABC transporter substrate-binding protein [Gammaproteobacteria bacterium 53_120_T64]|nr:sugar ABC transporter substrate-binding protein [Gammaproteobacteria bacterium 53_120_T64]
MNGLGARPLFMITALLLALLQPVQLQAEPYRVQVGDLIKIDLPGESSLEEAFLVNRQGRILLPEVGLVAVADSLESELKNLLSSQLGEVFLDLSLLQVYIAQRQLLISVYGYVKQPGEFTLPANGTVQMALHAAGGLRTGAQLNRIQLLRAGVRQVFNYKQYLDSGDLANLPQLKSLDSLFIPSSPMTGNIEVDFDPTKAADAGDAAEDRRAIKIFGEVNNPGSYSYRASASLIDLLMRAGGVTRYAGIEQIRLISQGEPKLFNLKHYLDQGDGRLLPPVEAGATIFVPHKEEQVKTGGNIIYVMGEVAKPGAYEGQKGATFMDILSNAGGPTRFAESRQIRILRANGEIVRFDLAGYTEGTVKASPPNIQAGDAIFVPEKTDMNEKSWLKVAPDRAVRVIGEVLRPGRIEWSDEMTLLDLLAHVGGPSSTADTSNIDIIVIDPQGRTRNRQFNLDAFISGGHGDHLLPQIRAGATVRIHELPRDPANNKSQWVRQASEKSIYVFGQVGAPGRYMFTDTMHFLDILAAADGPTGNADLHNVRISHRGEKPARISRLNLALYFETGDEELLPEVRTGDTIFIPEKDRIWLEQSKETTVRVIGAVNKPGRYRFNDNMTLLDLLAEAGGPSSDAYIQKITVINLSCCQNQARSFDLADFSRNARIANIPVLRAGDTIFIPNKKDSTMGKIRTVIKDIFQISALALLL